VAVVNAEANIGKTTWTEHKHPGCYVKMDNRRWWGDYKGERR
jgi:hypothetical protein